MPEGSSLYSVLVDLRLEGYEKVDAQLRVTEEHARSTESALKGIGDGTQASSKKTQGALGGIADALKDTGREADKLSKKSVTLKASLSGNKQVEAGLDAIGKRSGRIDGSTVTLKTTLAGSQAVLADLSKIDGVSSKVDGNTVTVTAQVKGGPEGEAQLSRLGAAASKIDGDQLTMSAEVKGAASAIGELAALDSRASSVDGQRVALDVDTSSVSKLQSIGGGLQGLSSDIRSFSTVAAGVVGVPALIAGIGGLVPIAVAGGGAILQLAGAIGQGLAGAAVVGGGALGTLAGAIGLVAAPVKMLLGTLGEYDQSLEQVKSAQASAATASQAYAQAQKGVADAQANAAQAAKDAGQAVSDAEANLGAARTDGARAIQDAERGLAEARKSGSAGIADAEQGLADARREGAASIRDAEQGLAEARRSGAAGIASAEQDLARTRQEAARSIADAEQGLVDARQSAAESVADAEDSLTDARDGLESATQSLMDAEAELADIRDGDEAVNRAQAEDDLKRARLEQTQALEDLRAAEREFGKGSTEAQEAQLDLNDSVRDYGEQLEETQEIRKNGSEELQNAQQGVKDAAKNQQDAAKGVQDAEQNLAQTREDAARQVADAQQALSDAQREASQSISDASSALASARADAARQTQAAERALAEARSQAARDVRTAEGELASARADAAGQSREAQRALSEAHRASAEQIATAEQGLSRARQDAARQVADAQKAVTEAQKNAAAAAKAAAVAQQGVTDKTVPLTNAQKRLYDEYQRFKELANTAFLPAQNAAANLGVQILKLAEGYLPRLGEASTATMDALSRAFSTFRAELAGPVEQAGITRYLALIPKFTEAAATGAGRLALALFNLFTRSLKYVMPLTNAFSDMASRFLAFTRSVEGGRQIDSVFATLVARAGQLWQAIKNLSAGFAGLFRSLAANGGFDRVMQGFVNLTGAFKRFTAEGSRGSKAIQDFMRSAQPALNQLWGLAKDVTREFFILANNIASAGRSGDKMGTLAEVIKGIRDSVRPLRKLFEETFTALGPVLAKLIPELADLANTFLGSTGPLKDFLKGIQRVLHWFNDLSPKTKTLVANLVALKAILGILGVGTVVAPMGRFASNMFLANSAASKLAGKSALAGVAGGLGKIGLLLAGGIGLAALGGALLYAYNKNEDFRKSVNELGGKIKTAFAGVGQKIEETLIPALKDAADKASGFLDDVFDLKDSANFEPPKKYGQKAGGAFVQGYKEKLRGEVNNADDEGSWQYELGFKSMSGVASGINAWASGKGGGKGGGKGSSGRAGGADNPIGNYLRNGVPGLAWLDDNIFDPLFEDFNRGLDRGFAKIKWGSVAGRVFGGLGNYLKKELLAELKFIGPDGPIAKALTGGLEKAWRGLGIKYEGSKLQKLVQDIKGIKFGGGVFDVLGRAWRQLDLNYQGSELQSLVKKIGETKVGNKVFDGLKSGWNKLGIKYEGSEFQGLVKKINDMKIKGPWDALKKGWENLDIKWEGSALQKLYKNITGGSEDTKKKAGGSQRELGSNLKNIWDDILTAAKPKWLSIAEAIFKGSEKGKSQGGEEQRKLQANSKNIWDDILRAAKPKWLDIAGAIIGGSQKGKEEGGQKQRELESNTKNIWGDILTAAKPKWLSIADAIISGSEKGKEGSGKAQRENESNTKNIWQRVLDASDIWGKIGDVMGVKSWDAHRKVESAFGAIVGFINKVLSAVKLPTISLSGGSKPPPAEKTGPSGTGGTGSPMRNARGGLMRSGMRVHRMARGGIVPQDAVGGVVNGVMPHAVYGEAGSEAYVRLDKKTPESANALYTANEEWAKRGWLPEPESHNEGAGRHMARGGLLGMFKRAGILFAPHGATAWENLWNPRTAEIARETENATGAKPNTYEGHPDGFGERAPYSIDWWGSSGRGDAVGVGLGDKVLQHITDKYQSEISYWMWNAKASSAALNAAISADPHGDHVHGTFKPGLDMMGGGAGGIGGAISSLWDSAGSALWNKLVQPPVDSLAGSVGGEGSGIIGDVGAKLVTSTADKIKDYIIGGSGSSSGSGTTPSGGGGSADQNRALAEKMLASSSTGGSWSSLLELWNRESQFNQLADNPSSSAYGIPQALTDLHSLPKGYGPPGGDPGAQIGWGLDYIGGKYGTTDAALSYHDKNNSYAKGGVTGKAEMELPSPVKSAFLKVAHTLAGIAGFGPKGNVKIGDEGGVGTGKHLVAITNEAGPEAIVPKRRTPQGAMALREANSWYGKPDHRTNWFASGGVSGGYPVMDWNLVGGDDYLGVNNQAGPMYSRLVSDAMGAIGAMGGLRVGPGNDVTVTSGYLDGLAGITYRDGRIVLNPNAKNPPGVARHELLHASGHPHNSAVSQMNGAGYITDYDRAVHAQIYGKAKPGTPAPTKGRVPSGGSSGSPSSSGGISIPGVSMSGGSINIGPSGSGSISQTSTQSSSSRGGGIAAGPRGGARIQGLSGAGNVNIQMPGLGELKDEVRRLRAATERNRTIEIGDKSIGKQADVAVETARGYAGSREFGDKLAAQAKAAARSAAGAGRR